MRQAFMPGKKRPGKLYDTEMYTPSRFRFERRTRNSRQERRVRPLHATCDNQTTQEVMISKCPRGIIFAFHSENAYMLTDYKRGMDWMNFIY
jgi:hypothetical protein